MATVLATTDKNGGAFMVGNDWLRFARGYNPGVPAKGTEVEFSRNAKGYVDSLTVLTGPKAPGATVSAPSPAASAAIASAAGWSPSLNVKHHALLVAGLVMQGRDGSVADIISMTGELAQGFEALLTGVTRPSPARTKALSAGAAALRADLDAMDNKAEDLAALPVMF